MLQGKRRKLHILQGWGQQKEAKLNDMWWQNSIWRSEDPTPFHSPCIPAYPKDSLVDSYIKFVRNKRRLAKMQSNLFKPAGLIYELHQRFIEWTGVENCFRWTYVLAIKNKTNIHHTATWHNEICVKCLKTVMCSVIQHSFPKASGLNKMFLIMVKTK